MSFVIVKPYINIYKVVPIVHRSALQDLMVFVWLLAQLRRRPNAKKLRSVFIHPSGSVVIRWKPFRPFDGFSWSYSLFRTLLSDRGWGILANMINSLNYNINATKWTMQSLWEVSPYHVTSKIYTLPPPPTKTCFGANARGTLSYMLIFKLVCAHFIAWWLQNVL